MGYVKAIADNTALVAIYPRTNLGNLYHRTPAPAFVPFPNLYAHTAASRKAITPIHTSIMTLVITAEFSAAPFALRRPSTTDPLAVDGSVLTLKPIHTPAAAGCAVKNSYFMPTFLF